MHTQNAVFIHEFSTKMFPTVGRGNTPSPHSVASLPRFDPRLTNASCTSGTGIAKGYKSPCPPPPPHPLDWNERNYQGEVGDWYMPLHQTYPLIKALMCKTNVVFIHEFSKIFPTVGGGKHPPPPNSVASLPRFDPRLTNASCGTGIVKGYNSPCPPPPLDWSERI